MKPSSQKKCVHLLLLHVIFYYYFLVQSINCSVTTNTVKSLPGYACGNLPFNLETGYISVGDRNEVELFYYFVESEGDPTLDPLIFWHAGGPGCSGFTALAYEIGPVTFDISLSFPCLVLKPHSWTKFASIVFIDSPIGAGYSYATTSQGYVTSDTKTAKDNYTFIRKWLLSHPNFLKNKLYVGGNSYGSIIAPLLAVNIVTGNEDGVDPHMNLQGYIVGDSAADKTMLYYEFIHYGNKMGIISDELFELAKRSCYGKYVSTDPANRECLDALQRINECTEPINIENILEPKCYSSEPQVIRSSFPYNINQMDRTCKHSGIVGAYLEPTICSITPVEPTLVQQYQHGLLEEDDGDLADTHHHRTKRQRCAKEEHFQLSELWHNDKLVQEALHVRKGTITEWKRCNDSLLSYEQDLQSVVQDHRMLINKGYRVLAYSGTHDMDVPYTNALRWIRGLNLTIGKPWRPWTVDGQLAGYTETYRNSHDVLVTFATIIGAGHTSTEYKPRECHAVVNRWLSRRPL